MLKECKKRFNMGIKANRLNSHMSTVSPCSECCICLEKRSTVSLCKTCAEGIICDSCVLRLMEEGYSNCPICRSRRPELLGSRRPELLGTTTAEYSRAQQPGRILKIALYVAHVLSFEATAILYGYFMCFLFRIQRDDMTLPTVLLVGNVSLACPYFVFMVCACAGCKNPMTRHSRRSNRRRG